MSFLKKLFGGGGSTSGPDAPTETYNDFRITAQPASESGGYRIGALIEKDVDGETLSHTLIRADTIQGLEAAQAASISKARQVIDEQGDRIFGTR